MRFVIPFVILLLLLSSCTKQEPQSPFTQVPASQTNIHFNNKITDSPEFNILDYLYFYNGGGVAAGDLNNDGLPDLFFTSNLGADKLYINKGEFKFEDASDRFEENQLEGWSTGVTFADVNQDGWLDIYVCKLGNYGPYKSHNKLFINKKGKHFVESAKSYGLDFSGFGTQAAFLDYDRDGDLDCYLLNHSVKNPEQFRPSVIRESKDSLAGDLLLENVDGQYVDVTAAAGIYSSSVGFGLGVEVADVNGDGWLDIYVGNDFHENDYLYLNQQDKTFQEVIAKATGHTSNFSMGCSITDINNDLRPDILSLDMKPFEEQVYKKSGGWESMEIYNYKRSFGYHDQSARNALQMNVGQNEDIPIFSEQAAYYGLEATDWSWSPLVYDFDNDGDKDIYISNGIVRRPNDMDFVNFYFDATDRNKVNQIQKIPEGNIPNCYFQNNIESNSFTKKEYFSNSVSTGATVADLNQDGLLDIIVNNINAPATILKNTHKKEGAQFLRIKLTGDSTNYFALGASVLLYQGKEVQLSGIKTSSGFQSFNEPIAHFGLTGNRIDSIKIIWPDGFEQTEVITEVNKLYTFKRENIQRHLPPTPPSLRPSKNLANYQHQENNFNDQQAHKWLLYNQSTLGPRMTAVDEDHIYLTGNKNTPSGLINTNTDQFIPFSKKQLMTDENDACYVTNKNEKYLFVTHGGNEFNSGSPANEDAFYQINTNNDFTKSENALPTSAFNTSVCISNDFDKDGDDDIFVGIQSTPGQYGTAENSYLLLNDNNTFTKKELPINSMVYDAQWEDIDNNGFADLIIVGHWMPITILYNDGNNFEKQEIPESNGLWFSVYVEDLNGDGSKDIIAGNYGTNHSLSASEKTPIRFYQNDFDKNGYIETLVTYFKDGIEVPYPNQSSFASQIPGVKKKYLKNEDYATAKIAELVNPELLTNAIRKQVVELQSSYFIQNKNKGWQKHALPAPLQMSPLFAIEKLDAHTFFFGGNFYDIDPNWGRQDAGQLSAFEYRSAQWIDVSKKQRLPILKGAIRDLLFQHKKLYITINNDRLKVIDFIRDR